MKLKNQNVNEDGTIRLKYDVLREFEEAPLQRKIGPVDEINPPVKKKAGRPKKEVK